MAVRDLLFSFYHYARIWRAAAAIAFTRTKLLGSADCCPCSSEREDMMKKIKKFEPLSVMRIFAICYGLMGLIEGAFLSMIFLVMPMAAPAQQQIPHWLGVFFGGLSIIFFPILFGLMGAIMGGLSAVIYNVSARYVGGIQVEVE
jgi:hypothetical protein